MENTESKGRKSKYQLKKQSMKNGSYKGTSPFFHNIPEYQYDKPLEYYPCIQEMVKKGQAIYPKPKRRRIVFEEEEAA